MFSFKVPASIGNVGPGFDVLGLAVDGPGDRYTVSLADKNEIVVTGIDSEKIPLDVDKNTVFIAARKASELLDEKLPTLK